MPRDTVEAVQAQPDGRVEARQLKVLPWDPDYVWIGYSPEAYRAADGIGVRDAKCAACGMKVGGEEFTTVTVTVPQPCTCAQGHLASCTVAIHADCIIPDGDDLIDIIFDIAGECDE